MSKALLIALVACLAVAVQAKRSIHQYGPISAPSTSASGSAAGNNINIDPWTLGPTYPDQTANVGDTITFTWTTASPPHGVYRIPSGDCPATFANGVNGQVSIKEAAPGPQTVVYTFDNPGTYWFACPVDGHCDSGMKFKVTVS